MSSFQLKFSRYAKKQESVTRAQGKKEQATKTAWEGPGVRLNKNFKVVIINMLKELKETCLKK